MAHNPPALETLIGDEPPDSIIDPYVLEKQNEIYNKIPEHKEAEINDRLKDFWGDISQYGEEGRRVAIDQILEVVNFYLSAQKEIASDFQGEGSDDIVFLIQDTFATSCDLRVNTVSDINNLKKKIEERFKNLLKAKQEIQTITQDATIEQWFFTLVKDWKKERKSYADIEKELFGFLQKLQKEIQEDGKKREGIMGKINMGLLTEKEKNTWNNIINKASGKELNTQIKKISNELKKRETELPKRYQKNVLDNMEHPLKAREELKKLRKKFGLGIFDYLGASEVWRELNEIQSLISERDSLVERVEKIETDKESLVEKLDQINARLEQLTGKPPEENVIQLSAKREEKQKEEAKEETESDLESINAQITALKNLVKVINEVWLPESLKTHSLSEEDREEGIALFEKPESYAWLGGDAKVQWLKTHKDDKGEILWNKYVRKEAQCAENFGKDAEAYTEEFRPRVIKVPFDNLDKSSAQTLNDTLKKIMQGPRELVFLAGVFIANPQDDKLKAPSAPAEMLTKAYSNLARLEQKRFQAQQKRAT